MSDGVRPDVFIVGAFKAGTTTLYEYLGAHPQVFMSVPKEPMYFGADLTPRYRRMTEAEYLELFREADAGQHAGEASPWYLYSTTAAAEIRAFSPDAKPIVMLRNPVDVMYAQHSQLVFNRREDLADFRAALEAEDDRRAGRRLPPGPINVENLFYRHSVRFAEQLRRYFDVFGRERVHVIVFDDLVSDPRAVYRSTLEFIGVDPTFQVEWQVYNASRQMRWDRLARLIFAPPPALWATYARMRRLPLAHRVRDALVAANSRKSHRSPMDAELRRQLTLEFKPQVAELGELIGRDLSGWSATEVRGAAK